MMGAPLGTDTWSRTVLDAYPAALSSLEPPRTFPSPYNSSARQEMIKTMIPTINMTLIPPDPTWAIGKRTYQ